MIGKRDCPGDMSKAAGYMLTTLLSTDGQVALWRGCDSSGTSVLLAVPVPEQPDATILARLEREFALREDLDPEWAVRPLALAKVKGRKALVLEDSGGEPLSIRLGLAEAPTGGDIGTSLGIDRFLTLAISIVEALGKVHGHGLIHKNLTPAYILLNADGRVRLTGFGLASSRFRERQTASPPEELAGALEYMAPEQTGRMNRSLDHRGDLYSLGIIFYKILTGQLPFTANDPLEWVHCHVVRQPTPPQVRRSDIPRVLSDLIMRLLSKTAEERYQTAAGLVTDLRQCLAQWQESGRIEFFALGERDVPSRLLIPEKLYGREHESQALLAAVGRVIGGGAPEVVLVSGYSGVGKSSLINELHKAIVQPPGIFLAAKVDQYKRDMPYAAVAQCFQGFIRQILGRNEAELIDWRNRVREAVGVNGRLITDLIPELTFLIGPQPAVPDLSSNEAQNRFNSTFRNFVSIFAKEEHPLVLFLDDLQWQDLASLKLIEHLLTHPDLRHLLFIGAYRDNEVHPSHPLMLSVDAIRKSGASVLDIVLKPLSVADLGQLVVETLHCEPADAAPLVSLLHKKTGGNPFFAVQFLITLHDEGLLALDPEAGAWRWDLDAIRSKGYTDNVVDLMVAKLGRLTDSARRALSGLASLGNGCPPSTLGLVLGCSARQALADLDQALRAGYIIESGGGFKFVHDRVQEAAYALIAPTDRPAEHLRIGRLMAANLAGNEAEDAVFDIIGHMNRGIGLVTDSDERSYLGHLNALAGKKAKAAAAYASALTYLSQAMALAPEDCWERQFDRTFSLQLSLAECKYVVGELESAEALFTQILEKARSNSERASVYHLLCRSYFSAGRYSEAFGAVSQGMILFGITLPRENSEIEAAVAVERQAVTELLGGRPVHALLDLPNAADPDVRALMGLIADALPIVFVANPTQFVLLVLRGLALCLRQGVTRDSCAILACYAVILIGAYEDIETGYEFSDLALQLNDKFKDIEERGRLLYLHGTFANCWRRPFATSTATLEQAFLACREVGNLAHAGSALLGWAWLAFEQGDSLEAVLEIVRRHAAFARANRNEGIMAPLRHEELFLETLRGTSDDRTRAAVEAECLETLARVKFPTGIAYHHIRHQILDYLFGNYEAALGAAEEAAKLARTVMGMSVSATHHFFYALTLVALYPSAPHERRREIWSNLAVHRQKLELWARNCPENFGDRHAMLEAEIARLEGRTNEAMTLYERSMILAQTNGFPLIEGLASESASRFYRDMGLRTIAGAYLRQARESYEKWGAQAKVKDLEERYPDLALVGGGVSSPRLARRSEDLDVMAVVQAAQAVSGEIVLDKLIETMLTLVIEHAGAERGLLVLPDGDDYCVAAEASTAGEKIAVTQSKAPVTGNDLPVAILHFVVRTGGRVLLNNAKLPNPFTGDEYLFLTEMKSVLCLPLLKQAKLVGVLYLENKLVAGAFTPDRIAVLEHLASQAAISLENASLYAELQQHQAHLRDLVDKRTAELVRQKERLNQTLTELVLILNNASLGICTVTLTPNGRSLRRVNRSFEAMLGYERGELEGKNPRTIHLDDQEYEHFSTVYESVLQTGQNYRGEQRYRRKDGQTVIVSIVGSAIDPNDLAKGTIWLIEDITERKQAEKALADTNQELVKTLEVLRSAQEELVESEKLASLGSVVAGVAHEVNTPLGVGVTAASLIKAETRNLARKYNDNSLRRTDLASYIETATQSSEILENNLSRAAELIRSFKQVAVDQSTEDVRSIELGSYLNDIVSSLKPALRKAGHVISVTSPNHLWLETTPSAIWQIISNLVMNSIFHAYDPGQHGTLSVVVEERAKDISVTYSDDGKGMSAEVKRHIFEPFFTTSRGHGGSGLGLSIVYNLVTKTLGGSISCKSTLGAGSRFIILLPTRKEDVSQAEPSKQLAAAGQG
jgi:PAS domain S-box-containing protein